MTAPKRTHRKTPVAPDSPDPTPQGADIAEEHKGRTVGRTELGPGKPRIRYTVAGIERALTTTKGNRAAAAKLLGVSYDTLCRRFGRHPELLAFRERLLERLEDEQFASNQQRANVAVDTVTGLVVNARNKVLNKDGSLRSPPAVLTTAERWALAEAIRLAQKDRDAAARRRDGLAGEQTVLITQQTQTVFIDARTPEQYAAVRALPPDVRQRIIDGDPRPLELLLPVSPGPSGGEAAPGPPEVAKGDPG